MRDGIEPDRIELAGAKHMADRDPPGKPEATGALSDHLNRQCAHLAAVVQVNVEAAAMARRDREDAVGPGLEVAVDADWVEPANLVIVWHGDGADQFR